MDNKGGAADSLRKHLTAAGIEKWKDFSRESLYELTDHLKESVSPGTGKTVCARLKALLHRYADCVKLPDGWEKIVSVRDHKPVKTYLNADELKRLEGVQGKTEKQQYVLNTFLVCAYTGLRVSDALSLNLGNIMGGNLHYVAKKTRKEGVVPLKPGVAERIAWLSEHRDISVTMVTYNTVIRELCREAGIDTEVVIVKGGKEVKGPKWQFISSHSARISLGTCLFRSSGNLGDVMRVLQHSNPQTTLRYIVNEGAELSDKAMDFFK